MLKLQALVVCHRCARSPEEGKAPRKASGTTVPPKSMMLQPRVKSFSWLLAMCSNVPFQQNYLVNSKSNG